MITIGSENVAFIAGIVDAPHNVMIALFEFYALLAAD